MAETENQDWRQTAYRRALAGDWRQDTSGSPFECMCAGGIIAWAITGDPSDMYVSGEIPQLRAAMQEFIEVNQIPGHPADIRESPGWVVADWNDANSRTLEDVQNAFRKLVEAQGTP